jgi:hypothetical protein
MLLLSERPDDLEAAPAGGDCQQARSVEPNFAVALNARGVARAALGQFG